MRTKARPALAGWASDLPVGHDLDDSGLGRDEADAFDSPVRRVDPYAAWLALREEEQERTRPEIRWVYRHRPAAAGSETRSRSRDGGLVGTA